MGRLAGTAALTVAGVARDIRSGASTATEVMGDVLARIADLDRGVGSIVMVAGDARDRAREADARTDGRGPLHGVPVAVKDNVDVAGMPTRAGSEAGSSGPADVDAPVVAALRRAGAVPVAKTRMPELAYGSVTPGTSNPAAPGRTAGGSSGGSAAAVAAGLVPGAVGTDTGGSLRTPAAFCGVVGFRPSHGLIPMAGVVPLAPSLDVVGPVATSVEDCALLFDAMRGTTARGEPVSPRPLAGVRLAILSEIAEGARPDVAQAFAEALDACTDAGAVVHRASLGDPSEQTRAFATLTAFEAARAHGVADRYGPGTMANLERGRRLAPEAVEVALGIRREVAAALELLFEGAELVVAPTVWLGAPREEDDHVDVAQGRIQRDAALLRPTAPLSLAGVPVISLPMGPDAEGLPLGLQLAGRSGADDELLSVALAVESVLGRLREARR